jgi:hypothetical protein
MLKINATRASASPEFVEQSKEIARFKVQKFKDKITSMGGTNARQYFAKQSRGLLMNAGKMVAEPAVWDDIVTRLRCMEYTQFDVVTDMAWTASGGVNLQKITTFLHGKTKNVVLSGAGGKWNMGEYDVYFPIQELKNDGYGSFHFIPVMSPMTRDRHVHHVAYSGGQTPLSLQPSTCWGNFPSIIQAVVIDFDIVELFRNIWTISTVTTLAHPCAASKTSHGR